MYQQCEPESIQSLFASIASNYDKANTLFTFGLHKRWNLKLIETIRYSKCLLDLCAGTGEIAFGFLKNNPRSEAILLDFCAEMLTVAQKKGLPYKGRFELIQADAQAIPLKNLSVDAVSIAYGIRNIADPSKCFAEVYRVLTPQGRFGILELTRPTSKLMRAMHKLYMHCALPLLGKMLTKNKDAYHYLVHSVDNFSAPEVLESGLKQVGFQKVERLALMAGVATLFIAIK